MLNVDDCHLCQCPEWKDLSLTTASLMMNIDRTVLMDCMDSVEKWGGGYVPGSSVREGRQLGSFEPYFCLDRILNGLQYIQLIYVWLSFM